MCGLCLLLGDLARQDLALVAPPALLPVLLWEQASSFTSVWGLSPLPGVPSVPLAGTGGCCPSTALGCVPWGGLLGARPACSLCSWCHQKLLLSPVVPLHLRVPSLMI